MKLIDIGFFFVSHTFKNINFFYYYNIINKSLIFFTVSTGEGFGGRQTFTALFAF